MLRSVSVIILVLVLVRAFREYTFRSDGVRSTKLLLLLSITGLTFGTSIPLIQTICYALPACFPYISLFLIPASIAIAANVLLAAIALGIIYFTKEPPQAEAVTEIKKSLKIIGEQTTRAEQRSDEIDENTEEQTGKVMRGRGENARGRDTEKQKKEKKKENTTDL